LISVEGRIIKGVGGLYHVDTSLGVFSCSAKGIFRKDNTVPVIGDHVEIEIISEKDNEGVIAKIFPRKNELKRPRVCNVDQSILVFSVINPELNFDLLDRLIVLSEEQNLGIIICLNKIDITNEPTLLAIKEEYERLGYTVVLTSNTGELGHLEEVLKGKVSVFCGPSGVGKSSIINIIAPFAKMEVGDISSKNKKGKHTTRHTQLIRAFADSYIVDSPGFSSLFFDTIEDSELAYYFKEFREFLGECKYNNCLHINEPNCAIKDEVEKGNVSKKRYDRYVRFLAELTQK